MTISRYSDYEMYVPNAYMRIVICALLIAISMFLVYILEHMAFIKK